MHYIDWQIIVLYILGMLAIGVWAMRKIHDPGGFLLGKRKMGKLLMIASTFSSGTSAGDPVSVASNSYRSGVSGIWLSLSMLFLTPLFWLMPPAYRRLRMVTMADFIRMRYGREVEIFYNVVQTIVCTMGIGIAIKVAAAVATGVTGGQISEFWWQLLMTALILGYGIPGGVLAVFTTDILQSFLVVVLSFILLPFAAAKVGGLSGLAAAVPAEMFDLFSAEMSPLWIFWFVIGTAFSIMSDTNRAAHGGARNEIAARCGVFGMFVKRICTVGWMMAGVFAIGLYGTGRGQEFADRVFATMSAEVLPVGLLGVMVASILAAAMAMASAGMVFGASILLNNIYRPFFVPNASPRHYLTVARVCGAAIVIVGWLVATQVKSLVSYIVMVSQAATVVGLPISCALFWRRGTRAGAIASALTMTPLFYYGSCYAAMPAALRLEWLDLRVVGGELPLTVYAPLYLVPGAAVFVLVSLLTRQHDERSVREFYARLDTPVGDEHKLRAQGIQADLLENLDCETITVAAQDRDVSDRLILVDLLTFPYLIATGRARLSDYKWDFLGIVVIAAFAAAIIALVWGFAAVGSAGPR